MSSRAINTGASSYVVNSNPTTQWRLLMTCRWMVGHGCSRLHSSICCLAQRHPRHETARRTSQLSAPIVNVGYAADNDSEAASFFVTCMSSSLPLRPITKQILFHGTALLQLETHLVIHLNISNGNIFPSNAGVKIPLSFTVGYAFQ